MAIRKMKAARPMSRIVLHGSTININSGVFGTDQTTGFGTNAQALGTATVNVASAGVLALRKAIYGWTMGGLNGHRAP